MSLATVLTFKANFNDDPAAQTGNYTGGGLGNAPNEGAGWTGADSVDGTLTSTITTLRADNVPMYKLLTNSPNNYNRCFIIVYFNFKLFKIGRQRPFL